MKLFKFLSHPYTLIISFCLIMISGEHLGGFYALYILLGLFAGAVHSLLALAGIIILLIAHLRLRDKRLAQILNIIGVLFLFASIYYFFWNDKQHYNYGTFEQTVPMITMVWTTFTATCFLIGTFIKAPRQKMMII